MRYVDDTLLLVTEKDHRKDINFTRKHSNSFNKNITFTTDTFPDGKVHSLNIKVSNNHTHIYYKDTHTGQYTSFHSQTLWRLKTSSTKALFHRTNKICSSKQAFQQNAYEKYVRYSIINRLKSNVDKNDTINNNKDDRKVIWINLPYLGKKGEQLTNYLIRKL